MRSYSHFLQESRSNQTTCVHEVQRFLDTLEQQSVLNAFLESDADAARAAAVESDQRFSDGTERALEGMVIAMKDNISVKGFHLTCSSKILEDFKPVFDATVVQRLKAAGAIIIGKTNCDEFAMGSSNENSAYGPVLHPVDHSLVPGGSSGGSAVAVAAAMAHASFGSDTGGSIRQPAAFCGVLGYKPSYGRVSRYGLVAFASSLDQIGPFTCDIDDMARIMDVISGADPADATSAQLPPMNSFDALSHHDESLTVGVLEEHLLEGCSPDVLQRYHECIKVLEAMGCRIKTVSLAGKDAWIPTYYILATAEASANLARFDGVRFGYRAAESESGDSMALSRSGGFGAEVKRRIMLGTFVLSSGYYDAYYKKGQQARQLVVRGYEQIFDHCNALFLPTTPTTAFKRGEKSDNPIEMYLNDLLTVSANLAGIPAISIPCGNDSKGLAIGMQLQAASMDDEFLLRLTKRFMERMAH